MPSRAITLAIAAGLWSGICIAQTPDTTAKAQAKLATPDTKPDGLRETAGSATGAARKDIGPEDRGDIYMARKMYREAIEAYQEGPAKDAVLQNKIGIAYHQMMQLDRAKKFYEKAIKLKPDYMEAQNNLGTVYYAAKSYRKAINCYRQGD